MSSSACPPPTSYRHTSSRPSPILPTSQAPSVVRPRQADEPVLHETPLVGTRPANRRAPVSWPGPFLCLEGCWTLVRWCWWRQLTLSLLFRLPLESVHQALSLLSRGWCRRRLLPTLHCGRWWGIGRRRLRCPWVWWDTLLSLLKLVVPDLARPGRGEIRVQFEPLVRHLDRLRIPTLGDQNEGRGEARIPDAGLHGGQHGQWAPNLPLQGADDLALPPPLTLVQVAGLIGLRVHDAQVHDVHDDDIGRLARLGVLGGAVLDVLDRPHQQQVPENVPGVDSDAGAELFWFLELHRLGHVRLLLASRAACLICALFLGSAGVVPRTHATVVRTCFRT